MMSSIPMFVRFRSPPDTPRVNSVPTCNVAVGYVSPVITQPARLTLQ